MAFGKYVWVPYEVRAFRDRNSIENDAYYEGCGIEALLGKTIVAINGGEEGDKTIHFVCSDGTEYLMYHEQDCCESVTVEDVCGDLQRLLNTPITLSEDISNEVEGGRNGWADKWGDHYTWTWYKLATVNEYVTIRWYGESNGYYSESVEFARIK